MIGEREPMVEDTPQHPQPSPACRPLVPRCPPSPLLVPSGKRARFMSSPTLTPATAPPSPSLSSTVFSLGGVDSPESVEYWYTHMQGIDAHISKALQELRLYICDWKSTNLDPFWHRKSGKPVLSVVIWRKEDGTLATCRGMNTEVSLPAGSLCAERAAIARGATEFLKSSNILAVAVADPEDKLNPLWPCEVCMSWLVKLRTQSPHIAVIAVQSSLCDAFTVRVNGESMPPPLPPPAMPPLNGTNWAERVELVDEDAETPWEARDVVYVDGAWTFLHSAQQSILRNARARGSHLMVGVHSDDVLKKEFDGPVLECFQLRAGRIAQSRYVSSVLKDAPWTVTEELIHTLNIKKVVTGSVCKVQDVGSKTADAQDPYKVPRELGILEVVPSVDETTERTVHDKNASLLQI